MMQNLKQRAQRAYSAVNWDDVFAYNTTKLVRIQDRRIGLLSLAATFTILVFLLYYVLYTEQGYNEFDTISGFVKFQLHSTGVPTSTSGLSYCNGACNTFNGNEPGCNCIMYGALDSVYPEEEEFSMFMATRVRLIQQERRSSPCVAGLCYDPWNTINISDTLNLVAPNLYDLTISHNAYASLFFQKEISDHGGKVPRGSDAKWSRASTEVFGQIKDYNGKVVFDAPENSLDTFQLDLLLSAAGISYENIIQSGGIMRVVITWGDCSNFVGKSYKSKCNSIKKDIKGPMNYYYYSPQWLPDTNYYVERTLYSLDGNMRTVVNMTGIKIHFVVTGNIGQFSVAELLVSLVSVYILFSVATFIMDFIVIYVVPGSKLYRSTKFERTQNFRDMRNNIFKEQSLKKKIESASKLARFGDFHEVEKLLNGLKNNTTEKDVNLVILAVIEIYGTELLDKNSANKCLERLATEEDKVKAYIILDELKEAYLIAARLQNHGLVKSVLSAARSSDNARVQTLCEQYLAESKQGNSRVTSFNLATLNNDIDNIALQIDTTPQ